MRSPPFMASQQSPEYSSAHRNEIFKVASALRNPISVIIRREMSEQSLCTWLDSGYNRKGICKPA